MIDKRNKRRHEREMTASRRAKRADAIRIDAVLIGVLGKEPYRIHAIGDTIVDVAFPAVCQSILDARTGDPALIQLPNNIDDVATQKLELIATDPTATVDIDDQWRLFEFLLGRGRALEVGLQLSD